MGLRITSPITASSLSFEAPEARPVEKRAQLAEVSVSQAEKQCGPAETSESSVADFTSLVPEDLSAKLSSAKIQLVSPEATLNTKDLTSRLEVAKVQNAVVAKIVERCDNDESIDEHVSELISMVYAMSNSNLLCAESSFKEGKYSDVGRYAENVSKAARAAADYEAVLDSAKIEAARKG